ncbi:porin, opacity type [Afipia carboxidovorans OM5]|uniref:Outer membrane protein beta-barrel domain-containing protein n=1 Tax=Afipia carboxidovorans (strain ATCC 49405 / DSM 1227 / KCTC 32145 / OM5) TaxID=504832 RepID=B6JIL0_AFIC5|nr:outer membrane beta-barrel protein [Afipia carboxidovorans]ACI94266.1 porin, opacity type [Afipia carboxidovorans OM5]AEI02091.1 hypothetical protein OCA4_c09440 [Afipia carboxidovorans OM4]AEI05667.1 hypothetical protein OCA5_c09450 [Afipia carboxidovorans OM5]
MRYVKTVVAAGAVALLSGAASAADMPLPPPYMPPPVQEFGGWYLRGDIGFSNQRIKERHYSRYDTDLVPGSLNQSTHFDSAGIYGLGVGYQFNSWLRMDVTGEYRAKSNYRGRDTFLVSPSPGTAGADNYTGHKSEWLVLTNAYADLGTWWNITPFVGAGIGAARVTLGGFNDYLDNGVHTGVAADASKWNFAWALHAGLAYKLAPNWTMELAYRYVDMGDGVTGILYNTDGSTINQAMHFKHITSHDLKFGVRWAIDPAPAYYHPPLITKG